eukprot:3092753-Prorocentrum_lima.AAC.1
MEPRHIRPCPLSNKGTNITAKQRSGDGEATLIGPELVEDTARGKRRRGRRWSKQARQSWAEAAAEEAGGGGVPS